MRKSTRERIFSLRTVRNGRPARSIRDLTGTSHRLDQHRESGCGAECATLGSGYCCSTMNLRPTSPIRCQLVLTGSVGWIARSWTYRYVDRLALVEIVRASNGP